MGGYLFQGGSGSFRESLQRHQTFNPLQKASPAAPLQTCAVFNQNKAGSNFLILQKM